MNIDGVRPKNIDQNQGSGNRSRECHIHLVIIGTTRVKSPISLRRSSLALASLHSPGSLASVRPNMIDGKGTKILAGAEM